jgi:hypothetical protein
MTQSWSYFPPERPGYYWCKMRDEPDCTAHIERWDQGTYGLCEILSDGSEIRRDPTREARYVYKGPLSP